MAQACGYLLARLSLVPCDARSTEPIVLVPLFLEFPFLRGKRSRGEPSLHGGGRLARRLAVDSLIQGTADAAAAARLASRHDGERVHVGVGRQGLCVYGWRPRRRVAASANRPEVGWRGRLLLRAHVPVRAEQTDAHDRTRSGTAYQRNT